MRIAIAGGTGLIGGALAEALRARGDEVLVLTRGRPTRPGQLRWDPSAEEVNRTQLGTLDAFVNVAGTPIAQPWTPSHRRAVRQSRLESTGFAARLVAEQDNCALINGSAVGIYGPGRDGEELTESSAPGTGGLAELVKDWEAAAAPAVEAGRRVAWARTGVILAPRTLTTISMTLPALLGLASTMGSGSQYWPWITLVDEVRAFIHLIDHDIHGPVNLAAPTQTTQRDLSRALAERSFGRAWGGVPTPAFLFRALFREFADEIIGSKLVIPAVLTESGFTFQHATMRQAVAWLAGSTAAEG